MPCNVKSNIEFMYQRFLLSRFYSSSCSHTSTRLANNLANNPQLQSTINSKHKKSALTFYSKNAFKFLSTKISYRSYQSAFSIYWKKSLFYIFVYHLQEMTTYETHDPFSLPLPQYYCSLIFEK